MRKKNYTKLVGVLFSEEIYDKIVKITNAREITVSRFLREIVEEKVNQREEEGLYDE